MRCDMCGSEGRLNRAKIEVTEMNVCPQCSKDGDIFGPVKEEIKIKERKIRKEEVQEEEVIETVVSEFSQILK